VCAAGVQYVAENGRFTFTPGFLSIKLWWRERLIWGELPSRHFGDGSQVQRGMSAAMLGDYCWRMKRDAPETKYYRQAKRTHR
jgi:hypothetical protein